MLAVIIGNTVVILSSIIGILVSGFSIGVILASVGGIIGTNIVFILAKIQENKSFQDALDDAKAAEPKTQRGKDIKSIINEILQKEKENLTKTLSALENLLNEFENKFKSISRENEMQLNKVNVVVTASEELSASAAEVASRIIQVASKVEETSSISKGGLSRMDEVVKVMDEVVSTMKGVMGMAKELEDQTKEISEIISIIEDITDQTNLLALNAAIEAARAGEQGKGFAVVAGEVRKLAERTYSAAREISEKINLIVSKVGETYKAIESEFEVTKKGFELITEGKKSFENVTNYTNVINTETTAISTATEQQSKVTDEISRNLLTLLESAKNIDASYQEAINLLQRLKEEFKKRLEILTK
ncbi:MAG: methyl-accepting chemotaxis protein [bacterium]|nr:methyl-accepting chemotaxis protein [bacterium]